MSLFNIVTKIVTFQWEFHDCIIIKQNQITFRKRTQSKTSFKKRAKQIFDERMDLLLIHEII